MVNQYEAGEFYFVSLAGEQGGLLDMLGVPASADDKTVQAGIKKYRRDNKKDLFDKRKGLKEQLDDKKITQEQFDEQVKAWQQEKDDKDAELNEKKEAYDLKIAEQRERSRDGILDENIIWYPMMTALSEDDPAVLLEMLAYRSPIAHMADEHVQHVLNDQQQLINADLSDMMTRILIERFFAGAKDPDIAATDGGLLYTLLDDDLLNGRDFVGWYKLPSILRHWSRIPALTGLRLSPDADDVQIQDALAKHRTDIGFTYREKSKEFQEQLSSGSLTQEQYDEEIQQLQRATDNALASLDRLEPTLFKYTPLDSLTKLSPEFTRELGIRRFERLEAEKGSSVAEIESWVTELRQFAEKPFEYEYELHIDVERLNQRLTRRKNLSAVNQVLDELIFTVTTRYPLLDFLGLGSDSDDKTVQTAIKKYRRDNKKDLFEKRKGLKEQFDDKKITREQFDEQVKIWEQEKDARDAELKEKKEAYDLKIAQQRDALSNPSGNMDKRTIRSKIGAYANALSEAFQKDMGEMRLQLLWSEITEQQFEASLDKWLKYHVDRIKELLDMEQILSVTVIDHMEHFHSLARILTEERDTLRDEMGIDEGVAFVTDFLHDNPEIFWQLINHAREKSETWQTKFNLDNKVQPESHRHFTAFGLRQALEDQHAAELFAADRYWENIKYTNRTHWHDLIETWIEDAKRIDIRWHNDPQPEVSIEPLAYQFSHYIEELNREEMSDIPSMPVREDVTSEFSERQRRFGQGADMDAQRARFREFLADFARRQQERNQETRRSSFAGDQQTSRNRRFGGTQQSDRQSRFGGTQQSDRQSRFGGAQQSDRQSRFGRRTAEPGRQNPFEGDSAVPASGEDLLAALLEAILRNREEGED